MQDVKEDVRRPSTKRRAPDECDAPVEAKKARGGKRGGPRKAVVAPVTDPANVTQTAPGSVAEAVVVAGRQSDSTGITLETIVVDADTLALPTATDAAVGAAELSQSTCTLSPGRPYESQQSGR